MAFTYDITTNRGKVRFLLGDTDSTDYFLSDAEVDYLLTTYTTVAQAAIEGCNAILANLAKRVDKSIGDLSLSLSQRFAHYQALLAQLKASGSNILISPFCGGISQVDKESVADDDDRVLPAFARQMMTPNGDNYTESEDES